jgi:nitronate monooxygenase
MTAVSGLELVAAATAAGIGGSFPAHNAGPSSEFDRWLAVLQDRTPPSAGPVIPNLIVHRSSSRLQADVEVVCHRAVPAVITSVGSPAAVIDPLHEAGIAVLADVASMRHARRAIDVGVDGLVLLAAGGGGQTGWANPFAFVRAVREVWDGLVVLAGGVADGQAMLGAIAAGFDLVYMGTPFIATHESVADVAYKEAIVRATMDDIEVRSDLTGLPVSTIKTAVKVPSSRGAGAQYDVAVLEGGANTSNASNESALFSAGHSATGVRAIRSVADLVAGVEREFLDAYNGLPARVGIWTASS